MKQIKSFTELRKYLQSIPNIDNGGCAIAALTMHRWLKQRDRKSEIVYFYGDQSLNSMKENNNFQKSGKGIPMSCSHAYVQYLRRYYDVEGITDDPRPHHSLSEAVVVQTINNVDFDIWNEDFDHKKFVPLIERNVGVNLKDIKL